MGNDPGWRLWNTRAGKRQRQSFVIEQASITLNLYRRSLLARHSLRVATFSAKNKQDPERSMEFIDFYIFKCHHGEQIRLKYYAGMVVIMF